jgi:hypothetical protein
MELREREKGKDNDRAIVISHTKRCENLEDIRMYIKRC